MFSIQPPLEVKEKVEHLAEEIRKTLQLTNGSLWVKFEDRKVEKWNVQVESR